MYNSPDWLALAPWPGLTFAMYKRKAASIGITPLSVAFTVITFQHETYMETCHFQEFTKFILRFTCDRLGYPKTRESQAESTDRSLIYAHSCVYNAASHHVGH